MRSKIFCPRPGRGALTPALTFLFFTAGAPTLFGQEPPTEAPQVQQARAHLAANDFEKAASTCREAPELTERDRRRCHLVTATAMNRAEDFAAAEEAARRLIEDAPPDEIAAAGHRELGLALIGTLKASNKKWPRVRSSRRSLRKLEEAESAFRRSLELSSQQDLTTRVALADVLSALVVYRKTWKDEKEMREILFDFLDKAPEDPKAEWAKVLTCTSERYDALLWDPRGAPGDASTEDRHPAATDGLETSVPIEAPQKLFTPEPVYSHLARAARLEGRVVVQAIIDKSGKVSSIKPLERLPLCLTEEAMLAVQQWEFEPATADGEPVSVYYELAVYFSL